MYLFLVLNILFSCNLSSKPFDKTIDLSKENIVISDKIENQLWCTNKDIMYWKELFDQRWREERPVALKLSLSKGMNQEYYFLSYYIDGLVSIWQATEDNKYLDEVLLLINNTLADVKAFKTGVFVGYEGWPTNNKYNWGHALWDSYYWRNVVTLMRVMHEWEDEITKVKYKEDFDTLLKFTKKNIWDRYNTNQKDFVYRVNTHMASHWARIGMEMFLITGENKYKTIFNNISFGTMIGKPAKANIRNQFFKNLKQANGIAWYMDFDNSNGVIQDTEHAGAVVSFIINAYENGMYWTENDITALLYTAKNVVWTEDQVDDRIWSTEFVDGSGKIVSHRFKNEWMKLGRFDRDFQDKIKRHAVNYKYYGSQLAGIGALNEKILAR